MLPRALGSWLYSSAHAGVVVARRTHRAIQNSDRHAHAQTQRSYGRNAGETPQGGEGGGGGGQRPHSTLN
jgi:hypothetical protein